MNFFGRRNGTADARDIQSAPGPGRGVLAWLRDRVGGWAGPRFAAGTRADRDLHEERVAAGPRNVVLPNFLPFFDDLTGETPQMRLAYRRMMADPNVKAACLGKLYAVAALDLQVRPSNKKRKHDRRVAEFVRWNLEERLTGGIAGLVESVIWPGLVDGFCVTEKVWGPPEPKGRWAGKIPLARLKSKDPLNDIVVLTDAYRNIVGIQGLRYNAGEVWSPSHFVIWRHLPLFDSATGMSDFRAVYGRYWLLDTATKLRAMGIEKRALPLLLGRYVDKATEESLKAALALAKSQNWIAVPEDAKVEAVNIAGSGDEIFSSFIRDLREEIFLGIQLATLQALTGGQGQQRGNSQVHQDTSQLAPWRLGAAVASVLNDREQGLAKDIVDLNYVVDDYPKSTLSAVDVQQMQSESQLDQTLVQMGVPLSLEATYERYGRTPPKGPDDRLGPPQPPPGGPPGGPQPPGGGTPFVDDAVNVLTVPPKRTLLAPGGGPAGKTFRGFGEEWRQYLAG